MQALELSFQAVGFVLGLMLGFFLISKMKKTDWGKDLSTDYGNYAPWAGICSVVVFLSVVGMMFLSILATAPFGIAREVKEGKVYLMGKRVTDPSEVYKYVWDGFFLSSEEKTIREMQETIHEIKLKAGYRGLSKDDKYNIKIREKGIAELQERIAAKKAASK